LQLASLLTPPISKIKRVSLVNDFLLLQLTLFISLIFFLLITENFFLLINSIIFLLLISTFLWTADLDIYVNFLLILDLGVFFVLIAFLINLSHLFQSNQSFNKQQMPLILGYALVHFLLMVSGTVESTTSTTLLSLPCTLSLYDWYAVFSFSYFSDLQLLSDLYYSLFSFEFLLMNFYLYLAIFITYLLFFLIKLLSYNCSTGFTNKTTNKTIFIRYQSLQKQINQTATVRVWSKKQLKFFKH